jgi:glucan phosphoethanolaminetransferase (alkaline phosphatase superfamily)
LKDSSSVKQLVDSIPIEDMSAADARVASQNAELIKKSSILIGSLAAVILLVAVGLVVWYKLNWTRILVTNIILLSVVAVIEFLFLTFIAQNYKSFDPNYVKYIIVGQLQKIKNS